MAALMPATRLVARLVGEADDPPDEDPTPIPPIEGAGDRPPTTVGPARRTLDGRILREIVVGGWLFEVELEAATRAAARSRSRRATAAGGAAGSTDVRAAIPGRIVRVDATPGTVVEAGRSLLVLEAMKMQNEVRAPRDGTVERVLAAVGENVEVGDVLVILA